MSKSSIQVVKATPEDSDALCHMMTKSSLPGLLKLSCERQGHFFNKYRPFSDDRVTYILKQANGELAGFATIMFTEALIEGERQTIGYPTDLRITKKRNALAAWSDSFTPLMLEEREKRNCQYIFSAIGKSQLQAYNAFIRPRSIKRNFPRYHQFRDFKIVGIHGVYPFADLSMEHVKIQPGEEKDIAPLQDYFSKHCKGRPVHILEKSEDLPQTLNRWPGMGIDNFLIARDSDGNIIGCCALWDPSIVERLRPIKKSKRVITLESTLKGLSFFGMTRPLMANGSKHLQFYQLSFMSANNPDIFNALLYEAFRRVPKTHFMVYMYFENQRTNFPSKKFIATQLPYTLYCMLGPDDPIPQFLKPTFTENPPDFEVAYI